MVIKDFLRLDLIDRIQTSFLACSIFLFLYPNFTWDSVSLFTPLAFALLSVALFIEATIKSSLNFKLYLFIFILYLVYSNTVGISLYNDYLSTPTIISILFLCFSKRTIYITFFVFVNIFGIFIAASLVFYIIKLVGIYHPQLSIQTAPDGRVYQTFPFNAMWEGTLNNALYLSTGFYRFHAFLNEPGFIGTISALILFALKFDFSRYRMLYVYLMACLLSMSLAAYLVLFIGMVYFISGKRLLLFTIPIVLAIGINFDLFDRFILSRLDLEEGNVSGDNRTSAAFDEKWRVFIGTSDLFFGIGKGQHMVGSVDGGVSSWKSLAYNSGLIGLSIYCMIFVAIYSEFRRNGDLKYAGIFLIVFLLTIYHRPNIHNIYYLLIFFGGILFNEQSGLSAKIGIDEKNKK